MSEGAQEYRAMEGLAADAGMSIGEALDFQLSQAHEELEQAAAAVRQHVELHPFAFCASAEALDEMRRLTLAVDQLERLTERLERAGRAGSRARTSREGVMSDREQRVRHLLRVAFGSPWHCHVTGSASLGICTISVTREKVQIATSGRLSEIEAVAIDMLRCVLAARDSIEHGRIWLAINDLYRAAEEAKS